MLTNNMVFEERTKIFSSGRLTVATSWKRMEKVTDSNRSGKDLTGNPDPRQEPKPTKD